MPKPTLRVLCLFCAPLALRAQSFADFTSFRNQEFPYRQVLQVEAGMIGAAATKDDQVAGLEDELAPDGYVFYHDEQFGKRSGQLDAYAGRDGLYASLRDGKLVGGETVSRIELTSRLWPFWREGFYRGKNFVPVGRYEGRDFEGYLGFGREAGQGMFIEVGPYWRRNEFKRNADTAPNYAIPENYNAYGARIYLEQRTVQMDRRSGMPRDGYGLAVIGEREWNDSSQPFGVNSGFETELPKAVFRARGRLEAYLPQANDVTWEVLASGMWLDEKDRVVEYDAQHPQGSLWADAQLRLRFLLSDDMVLTPFVQGQFTRILQEDGVGSDQKFFFGGGFEGWLHVSDAISLTGWYSYLDNESRPSVSIDRDLHGQHMFFAGVVLRLGATRK